MIQTQSWGNTLDTEAFLFRDSIGGSKLEASAGTGMSPDLYM